MPLNPLIFIGFIDRASPHTWNITSLAWVIYSPSSQVVSSGDAFLGPVTINIVEYSIMIELLSNNTSLVIWHILNHLDLQLIVFQLNSACNVCESSLLRKYIWVNFLEWNFESIPYIHISRSENYISDALANFILN